MQKKTTSTKGFAIIELLLAVAVVLVLGVAGVLVYNQRHKPKSDTTANSSATSTKDKASTSTSKQATADPYAGWNTQTMAGTSLAFEYPAGWTVKDTPICGGAHSYQAYAPESEFSSLGAKLTSYSVNIVTGANSSGTANCAPSGTSTQGISLGAQSTSTVISSGALKGSYVVVHDGANGTTDLFVLTKSYSAGQKINESGVLTVNGTPLQVSAGFSSGQDIGQANTSDFLSARLYKDTLNMLNSFAAN